jgi:hypothetical protein
MTQAYAPVYYLLGVPYLMKTVGIIFRWFWVIVFFFAGLGSLFAMIASIINFQILGALGFFVLMIICYLIYSVISDSLDL